MRRDVSIIVPTINEAENIVELIPAIARSLAHVNYEVLVIDDGSSDGTVDVCGELAKSYPITGYSRPDPTGGLSGAVLHGFMLASGDILVVMDADLQHPPEALPALIEPLMARRADFVIGSRRVAGSTIVDAWGPWRHLNSTLARWLAAPLTPGIRDPLSGFFALRRATWEQAENLNPLGYKIALELLCKCPINKVAEIPIQFGIRRHGSSKLTVGQRTRYLRHLIRLYASYTGMGHRVQRGCHARG
jgi:dolichol-phosphate mannosyltransferase